jgi:hypothetical protein
MTRAIATKDKAGYIMMEIIKAAEVMTNQKVAYLQTDEGGEFRSKELLREIQKRGITVKQTIPYHSQINPVAERINRTITTMARTMLIAANLSKYLWTDAVKHAAYTKNRLPHKALNVGIPIERCNLKLNIIEERKFPREFGGDVWVHLPERDIRDKFTARAIEGQIIGYTETHEIYKVYCKDRKIRITKNPKS